MAFSFKLTDNQKPIKTQYETIIFDLNLLEKPSSTYDRKTGYYTTDTNGTFQFNTNITFQVNYKSETPIIVPFRVSLLSENNWTSKVNKQIKLLTSSIVNLVFSKDVNMDYTQSLSMSYCGYLNKDERVCVKFHNLHSINLKLESYSSFHGFLLR